MNQRDPAKLLTQLGANAMSLSRVAQVAEAPVGLRVEMWQLQVPFGTVSRNEKFWKHVDEQCIDPATYDLLYKNGVRVGQAPISDWDYFRDLIADHPAVSKVSDLVAAEAKPVEFIVRKEIPAEDIWYYDTANRLIGRSYDASDNLITVAFQQAPRKPQTMRVALCPVVRSRTKRLEFSPLNREMEVTYSAPERLYDLNLRTDVPADSFLIIAPSSQASSPTSIGHNFFITEAPAEQMENVLLIVPKSIRIEPVIADRRR